MATVGIQSIQQQWRANMKRYVARNQQAALAYLLEHPCVDCGEADPVVLDFDHVRGRKRFAVGLLIRKGCSLTSLHREIAKCDVRCANCHRRRTAKERAWYRNSIAA